MPRIDFGAEDDVPARNPAAGAAAAQKLIVTWVEDSQEKTALLMAQAIVEAGRLSSKEICLRVEPASDPSNYERSKAISKHHFSLRYIGSAVQFVDVGSASGSSIDGKPVDANAPVLVERNMTISVADVLRLELNPVIRTSAPTVNDGLFQDAAEHASDNNWLQSNLLGAEKPGGIDFLRITRKDNLPNHQYLLLFHSGSFGSEDTSLFRVPVSEKTPRRKRAFDIGNSTSPDPARLMIRDGVIWIERTGTDDVRVGDEQLAPGASKRLPDNCEVVVANTRFVITPAISN
jgi:pSer/pThr/pTyr-binding forkhead associated (FHA) protein